MDLEISIYAKKTEDGRRYWIGISTPEQDENGNSLDTYINASLMCNMSKNARAAFGAHAEVTKNPDILKLRCTVTSGWLKAVKTKDGTAPVLFVNGIGPAIPRKPRNSDW